MNICEVIDQKLIAINPVYKFNLTARKWMTLEKAMIHLNLYDRAIDRLENRKNRKGLRDIIHDKIR